MPARRADEACALLHAAGLEVDRRDYFTDHHLAESMLRDVDRWLIDLCHLPV